MEKNSERQLITHSGVARLSAALSTPQICLQKFWNERSVFCALSWKSQSNTNWNRSCFSLCNM